MKKFATLTFALILGAFAFAMPNSASAGAAPQHLVLTGKDNLKTFPVPVGSTIDFNLNNANGGFDCGSGTVVQGDSVTAGGGTFTATKPGTSVISFSCHPPKAPAGHAQVNIIIGYRVAIEVQ
jgi:hypothetical protein